MISHDGWRFYLEDGYWKLAEPTGVVVLRIGQHRTTVRRDADIPQHVWSMVTEAGRMAETAERTKALDDLVSELRHNAETWMSEAERLRTDNAKLRQELERVAQVLGMPGSPDLTRDVAPRVKVLDELVDALRVEAQACRDKVKRLTEENVELHVWIKEHRTDLDAQRPEERRALIRWVVDWLLSRNGNQMLAALSALEYRDLMRSLDEILKHGGKPPNWVA